MATTWQDAADTRLKLVEAFSLIQAALKAFVGDTSVSSSANARLLELLRLFVPGDYPDNGTAVVEAVLGWAPGPIDELEWWPAHSTPVRMFFRCLLREMISNGPSPAVLDTVLGMEPIRAHVVELVTAFGLANPDTEVPQNGDDERLTDLKAAFDAVPAAVFQVFLNSINSRVQLACALTPLLGNNKRAAFSVARKLAGMGPSSKVTGDPVRKPLGSWFSLESGMEPVVNVTVPPSAATWATLPECVTFLDKSADDDRVVPDHVRLEGAVLEPPAADDANFESFRALNGAPWVAEHRFGVRAADKATVDSEFASVDCFNRLHLRVTADQAIPDVSRQGGIGRATAAGAGADAPVAMTLFPKDTWGSSLSKWLNCHAEEDTEHAPQPACMRSFCGSNVRAETLYVTTYVGETKELKFSLHSAVPQLAQYMLAVTRMHQLWQDYRDIVVYGRLVAGRSVAFYAMWMADETSYRMAQVAFSVPPSQGNTERRVVDKFDAIATDEVLLAAAAEVAVARLVAELESRDDFRKFVKRLGCILGAGEPCGLTGRESEFWPGGMDVINLFAWQVKDVRRNIQLDVTPLNVNEDAVVWGGRRATAAGSEDVVVKASFRRDSHVACDAEGALSVAGLGKGRLEILDRFDIPVATVLVARRYARLSNAAVLDLPREQRVAICERACEECRVLLAANIVHCDVHLGNLCVDPSDLSVKLIDYDDAVVHMSRAGVPLDAKKVETARAHQEKQLRALARVLEEGSLY